MGADKALVEVGGSPLAARVARALATVARPALAVGQEAGTGLEVVDDPRRGPLAAFVAGADALRERGCTGPILLVACDLPFVTARLLVHVARSLGGAGAAVPVAGGRDQPLASCYAPGAAEVASRLLAEGRDAMHDLLGAIQVRRLPEEQWVQVASRDALFDVDTPEDLEAAREILEGPA